MASKSLWSTATLGGRGKVKFLNDGKRFLVTTSLTPEWKIWSLETKASASEVLDQDDNLNDIAASADGKHVVTSSDDNTVKLWTLPNTANSILLTRFDSPVLCVDFSACDTLVACGSKDGYIKIINVADPKQIRKIKAHEGQVKAVSFDPQRNYLATAGSDGKLNIYDYINGDKLVASLMALDATDLSAKVSFQMGWSPNGKSLAVPTISGISLVTLKDNQWQISNKLNEYRQEVIGVEWSPNGKYLASSHVDQTLLIWNAASNQSIFKIKAAYEISSFAWNPKKNSILLLGDTGRYHEFEPAVPRNMPDPSKPLDADSSSIQQYELQKQNVLNMFADEESLEPQPTTAKSDTATTITAASHKLSTTSKQSQSHTEADIDDPIGRDDYLNEDSDSEILPPKKRSSYMDYFDDELEDERSNYKSHKSKKHAYSRASTLISQPPFMPSSTQATGSYIRRYLVWNLIGSIVARVEESSKASLNAPAFQTHLEIEFTDKGKYRNHTITKDAAIDLATLGKDGIFMSSRDLMYDDESTQKSCTTLHYQMFNKWGVNSDWVHRIVDKKGDREYVVGLACGDSWCAAATSKKRLRLFTDAGSKVAVISLPGSPLTMVGEGNLLAILFMTGATLKSNGTPKSFFKSEDEDNDGLLEESDEAQESVGWMIFHIPTKRIVSQGNILPLSNGAHVSWLGFSDEGALCVLDSKGVLRQLAGFDSFVQPTSNLISVDSSQYLSSLTPAYSNIWLDVLDASNEVRDQERIWPLYVLSNVLVYVVCSAGASGPQISPRPSILHANFDIPFNDKSKNTAQNQLLQLVVKNNVQMNQFLDSFLHPDGQVGDPVAEDDTEDQNGDDDDQKIKKHKFLIDLANEKSALKRLSEMDRTTLLLIKEAAQEGRVERAYGLTKTLVLKASVKLAIQIASKCAQPILADKIAEFAVRKEAQRLKKAQVLQSFDKKQVVVKQIESRNHASLPVDLSMEASDDESEGDENSLRLDERKSNAKRKHFEDGAKSKQGENKVTHISDDEFEVDDDEDDEDSHPPQKRFKTQQMDDDEEETKLRTFDKLGKYSAERDDEDATPASGSIFKSSPFSVAPPFQSSSGNLLDTFSKLAKPKTSTVETKKDKKSTSSSSSKSKSHGFFRPTSK